MLYAIYVVHVVISLFLILVVLLQQGKGADLSVFGGGGTQTAFGARGAATLLHKLTVWAFVAFVATTMTIGFLTSSGSEGTVMSDVAAEAASEADGTDEETAAATAVDEAAAIDESTGDESADGVDGAPDSEAETAPTQ